MTPETKGQPEPEPAKWIVVNGPLGFEEEAFQSGKVAEDEAAYWRERGHPDAHARPLYDYDVPALLEKQEKLVEALKRLRAKYSGVLPEGHALRQIEGIIEDALAAAREES